MRDSEALSEQSDETLVRLTCEQGSQFFGNLVKRHSDYLFGLGMRLSCGNKPMAEDLSQQALIKAFNYLTSFNPNHKGLGAKRSKRFRNWLTGIAVNCYSDLAKAESKYTSINSEQLSNAEASPQRYDELNEFQAIIRPLTTEERQIVTLRFVYEFTIEEIAGMLTQKAGTIKSKLSRAIARLRELENDETKI